MLEKQILNDKIEILEDGTIQVREVTRILEDGVIISQKNTNRRIIEPDADVSKEDQTLRGIAGVVRTPEKVAEYTALKTARAAELEAREGKSPVNR